MRTWAEDPIQIAIVRHYRKHYAGRIFHIPNGGRRGKLQAIRFKAMGVEAGVLDLCILNPARFAFMEVKADAPLSKGQIDFIADLADMGIPHTVVHSLDEAKAAFKEWGLALKTPAPRGRDAAWGRLRKVDAPLGGELETEF